MALVPVRSLFLVMALALSMPSPVNFTTDWDPITVDQRYLESELQ
jgi:hypothetical protein